MAELERKNHQLVETIRRLENQLKEYKSQANSRQTDTRQDTAADKYVLSQELKTIINSMAMWLVLATC